MSIKEKEVNNGIVVDMEFINSIAHYYRYKYRDELTLQACEGIEFDPSKDNYMGVYNDFCKLNRNENDSTVHKDNKSLYLVLKAWINHEVKTNIEVQCFYPEDNYEIKSVDQLSNLDFLKDIGIFILYPNLNKGGWKNQKWHLFVSVLAYWVVCKKGLSYVDHPPFLNRIHDDPLKMWLNENNDELTEEEKNNICKGFFKKNTFIIKNKSHEQSNDTQYYLKLNRESSCLYIYEKTDINNIRKQYPIRDNFDMTNYIMYELIDIFPCIFGGDGKYQTPKGIFNIEMVKQEEYISEYYPNYKKVKFFGYLVIFEDYFIHSDLYPMDVDRQPLDNSKSISLSDKHTSGCIRVSQENLKWLIENISEGTAIEL